MRKSVHLLLACCAIAPMIASSADSEEVGREIGAVLAGRMAPELVEEVVPLAFPTPTPAAAVAAVRAQVKQLLLETISAEGDAEQLKSACKAEADPASPRWPSNGMPQVQNSLAALYDWKIQKEKK